MKKDIPKYCPFCGADIGEHGHDDDCGNKQPVVRFSTCLLIPLTRSNFSFPPKT